MKTAHTVRVTPGRCGLYETTREIVLALRNDNIDARLVNTNVDFKGDVDRDVPVTTSEFIDECDVIVSHSGVSSEHEKTGKPIITVMHGSPAACFESERGGRVAGYTFFRTVGIRDQFKFFVTLWPEHVPYWEALIPEEKIRVAPSTVDLDRWTTEGRTDFGFNGAGGPINVLCADSWRADKDPYHVIHAFVLFAKQFPKAKLHIYGNPRELKGWTPLLLHIRNKGNLGTVGGWVTGLDQAYRAADILITPHVVATRVMREALACGCTVVAGTNCQFTPYTADPEDLTTYAMTMWRAYNDVCSKGEPLRAYNRSVARREFSLSRFAEAFIPILDETVS